MIRFLIFAVVGIAGLELFGALCHRYVVPARWAISDLSIFIPIGGCAFLSVLGKNEIGYRTRAAFAFIQSLVILNIFSNHYSMEIRHGTSYNFLIEWTLWIMGYTFLFTVVTHRAARIWISRQSERGSG